MEVTILGMLFIEIKYAGVRCLLIQMFLFRNDFYHAISIPKCLKISKGNNSVLLKSGCTAKLGRYQVMIFKVPSSVNLVMYKRLLII